MRRIIVGIALAAGMLAATVAHAVSAYLPVEYAETAPNGAYRLKVSASTDSTYLQQYMGGTWTTRTAWKNGERALNDLPVSSDSSISRVGTGSPTSPKRYKLNHALFSSDSTITRTGGAFTKKYTVSKTVMSVAGDSTLVRTGNNTATTPVKLKVRLAADSTIIKTNNAAGLHVNPTYLTVAKDSTLRRTGNPTTANPKGVAIRLDADSTVSLRGTAAGEGLRVPLDSTFILNQAGANIQTRYDSSMTRYGAAASKTIGFRMPPDSTLQKSSTGVRVPLDSTFAVSTGDGGIMVRTDSTFSRYGAAASKTLGLKLGTYNFWSAGLRALKVDFDDSTATGAWRFHSDADTLRLRYGTTGSFVTRWTFRPGTDLNRLEASHQAADNANQRGAFTLRHYDIQEEPMIGVFLNNATTGVAEVNIGGGAAQGNATEEVNFYTAGNTVTTTGTLRASIDSTGVLIGATKVNLLGSLLALNYDSTLARSGSNLETAPKKLRVRLAADSTLTHPSTGVGIGLNAAVASVAADSSLQRSGNNTSASPKALAVDYSTVIVAPADSSLKRTGGNSAASPKVLAVNPAMMTRAADSTFVTAGNATPASPKTLRLRLAADSSLIRTDNATGLHINPVTQGVATDSSLVRVGNGTSAVPKGLRVRMSSDSTIIRSTNAIGLHVNPAIQNVAGDSTLIRAGNATGSSPKTLKVRLAADSTIVKTDNATGLHVNKAADYAWTGAHTFDGAPAMLVVTDTLGYLSTSVDVGTVPAGSILLYATAEVITVFNAATTNVITFGYAGDADAYITEAALNEAATGLNFIRPDVGTTSPTAATKTAQITYAQTGDAATTGLVRCTLYFMLP